MLEPFWNQLFETNFWNHFEIMLFVENNVVWSTLLDERVEWMCILLNNNLIFLILSNNIWTPIRIFKNSLLFILTIFLQGVSYYIIHFLFLIFDYVILIITFFKIFSVLLGKLIICGKSVLLNFFFLHTLIWFWLYKFDYYFILLRDILNLRFLYFSVFL